MIYVKVMVIGNNTKMLINFRGDLIQQMATRGHAVIAVSPESGYEEVIGSLGADFRPVSLRGTGMNPFEDIRFLYELTHLIRRERPDVIFAYTIKAVVYSSLAARLCRVTRVYSAITGLGYVFMATGFKARLVRSIAKALYLVALRYSTAVIFENPDDMSEFIGWRLVARAKCTRVDGVGVNMDWFVPAPLPREDIFLIVCRVLKDKGVREYLEAARIVKAVHPSARFRLVGPFDSNPHSMTLEQIRPFIDEGVIEYLGEVADVRPYIASSSVFVLPSYREGVPRSTMEAMAMGRPVITTDVPGCRETVVDGVNGFLVPARSVGDLATRMIWMVEHRQEAAKMGQESIRICAERFDVNKVNQILMDAMRL